MGVGIIAKPYVPVSVTPTGAFNAKFPANNVLNNDYGRVARSTSAAANAAVALTFDFGSAKPVDVIAVLWHNLRSTDTIVVQAATSVANLDAGTFLLSTSRSAVTGGTLRDYAIPGKMLLVLTSPISARYWRITLKSVGTANPNGYFQLSKAVFCRSATFAVGAQKATIGAKDMNTSITTEVGESRSQEDPLLIRPVCALGFDYAKQSEMEEVLGAYTLSLGVSRPMLICPDLSSNYLQDSIVFGRPEQVISHESTVYDVWSFEAVVTSIGP